MSQQVELQNKISETQLVELTSVSALASPAAWTVLWQSVCVIKVFANRHCSKILSRWHTEATLSDDTTRQSLYNTFWLYLPTESCELFNIQFFTLLLADPVSHTDQCWLLIRVIPGWHCSQSRLHRRNEVLSPISIHSACVGVSRNVERDTLVYLL